MWAGLWNRLRACRLILTRRGYFLTTVAPAPEGAELSRTVRVSPGDDSPALIMGLLIGTIQTAQETLVEFLQAAPGAVSMVDEDSLGEAMRPPGEMIN